MNISRYLLTAFTLSCIIFFPQKALPDSIPFYVTYDKTGGSKPLLLQCYGPWLRVSQAVVVKSGADDVKFYSAKKNIFSPFGKWHCDSCEYDPIDDPGNCFNIPKKAHFCLKSDSDDVKINLTEKNITVNQPKDCDKLLTQAHLGDNSKPFNPDRDTFSFEGTEGDEVIITLEEDPGSGHIGERATLILRYAISWAKLKESNTDILPIAINTDVLPIVINAKLPVTGVYSIIVEQHYIQTDIRFRGDYLLSVESGFGDIEELRPNDNVEK